ncbi:RAVE protein 1 C terminal-domain-containing protein [Lipomyces arxii]|uniref:RAVE protein 1 C terminal-domain-containing protein n=1 Tax=Lipomyces arxii TaxID=56418 RepID=UPI0034CE9D1F
MASPGLHPGKPNPLHQALSTAYWNGLRLLTYASGNNLVILSHPGILHQTIYLDRDGGAVDIEENTGKIAIVSGPKVLIFAPSNDRGALLRWTQKWTVHLDLDDGVPNGVSWGTEEEIFISGKTISLWGIFKDGPHRLWSKKLAIPAMIAAFSFDAYLAATVGKNDRLVKVWRRFSYDTSNVDFDFSYLAHPRAVTGLRWRRPFSRSQSMENILYTICADGILRIWAPTDSVESSYMQMWASLDLFDVIPRSTSLDLRYSFIIDNKDFTRATESAVRNAKGDDLSKEKMKKLIEIASRNPDVCLVFDQLGRMAAIGIENIGSRVRKAFSLFDIFYDDTPMKNFPRDCEQITFLGFGASTPEEPDFALIMHDFHGAIRHYVSNFSQLLSTADEDCRLILRHIWTGHYKSVQSLVRTADGRALLSSSNHAENIVWVPRKRFGTIMLDPTSIIMAPDKVQRAVILESGKYIVTMQSQDLVLWDCHGSRARRVAADPIGSLSRKTILNLFLLPEFGLSSGVAHVVAVFSDQQGVVWEVKAGNDGVSNGVANGMKNGLANGHGTKSQKSSITKISLFQFPVPNGDTLVNVLSVDPVGWNAVLTGSMDAYARDVISSISDNGMVRSWTARMAPDNSAIHWLQTAKVSTGIKSLQLAKGSSMKKMAIVDFDSTRLTIWDIGEEHLEYEESFTEFSAIKDLDWTCTPDSQSILAVGFHDKVRLYCQLRFDYTKELPAWASFREIDMRQYTPRNVGDSIWLDDGTLVIGSGNQLFTHDKRMDTSIAIKALHLDTHKLPLHSIFDIVSVLNGPLPLYHPQLIAQAIFYGKADPVRKILVNLLKELKFGVPTDNNIADVTSTLGIDIDEFTQPQLSNNIPVYSARSRSEKYSKLFSSAYDVEEDYSTFNEKVATSLNEYLTQISLPYLTSHQQISLVAMIEGMGQVEEHRRSLDENGIRYLLSFRLFVLHKESMLQMPYRDHNWAFHSQSQEILLDLVSKSYNNRMTWQQARESGIFVWLKSSDSVKQQFESIARIIYTDSEPRNPVDCTLFYLALKKKQVLLGLWRMASWHKEQQLMLKFLANNFAEPRWKTAALKNAFVLLSKQRYEYAAAFFLLGGSLKDAVNVCVRNMNDIQLAMAITRVYEDGTDGPVFKDLLENEVLPFAYRTGDRWLASWAFFNLKRQDLALKCVFSSFENEINLQDLDISMESKLFLVEDPVLVVLYQQLREQLGKNLKTVDITPQVEAQFVLHIAKLYDRMGCDILALDLTKNWKFVDKLVENSGGQVVDSIFDMMK